MRSPRSFEASRLPVLLAVAVIGVILALWVATVLLARELLPGPAAWVDRFFAIALAATYLGGWVVAVTLARLRRVMLFRAVGTTLTALLVIAILEVPAAGKWLHWSLVFSSLSGEGAQDYTSSYMLDSALSFRRIPNRHWTSRPQSDIERGSGLPRSLKRPITFTYDRWGYRNAVEMPEADIVMLGDSFVEGWYVSDNETTAAVLGRRRGIRVANLGVAGYGTLQALRVLQGDGIRRNPRVIIWYFFEGNDLYDDQEFENAMLAAPPSAEDRSPNAGGFTRFDGWARRSFVLNAFQRLRWIFHPIVPNRARFRALLPRPAGPPLPIYFGPEASLRWTSYEDGRWATATRAFETGVGFARDRKLPVMLVFVPYKYRVFRDFITDPRDEAVRRWAIWPEFPAKFLELCRTLAVPCLDATGVLTEALRNGLLVYGPTDTHWSAEGHGVVAEELERRLKALRWVP